MAHNDSPDHDHQYQDEHCTTQNTRQDDLKRFQLRRIELAMLAPANAEKCPENHFGCPEKAGGPTTRLIPHDPVGAACASARLLPSTSKNV